MALVEMTAEEFSALKSGKQGRKSAFTALWDECVTLLDTWTDGNQHSVNLLMADNLPADKTAAQIVAGIRKFVETYNEKHAGTPKVRTIVRTPSPDEKVRKDADGKVPVLTRG